MFDAASDVGIYRVNSDTTFPRRWRRQIAMKPGRRSSLMAAIYIIAAGPCSDSKISANPLRLNADQLRSRWKSSSNPKSWSPPKIPGLVRINPKFLLTAGWSSFAFPVMEIFRFINRAAICMLDLSTRQCRRLAINSEQSESWHCWTSNGRWIVFSSKRLDGLFARPFFSYVDERGEFHKPFVLPKRIPAFTNPI